MIELIGTQGEIDQLIFLAELGGQDCNRIGKCQDCILYGSGCQRAINLKITGVDTDVRKT